MKLLNDLSQFYIDFYSHAVEDGMMVHDSCACVYVVAPELFTTIDGAVRVVCGGIADGQTIVKPDGRRFPPGEWDDLPSQIVCTGIESEKVISRTLIREYAACSLSDDVIFGCIDCCAGHLTSIEFSD